MNLTLGRFMQYAAGLVALFVAGVWAGAGRYEDAGLALALGLLAVGVDGLLSRLAARLESSLPEWIDLDDLARRLLDRIRAEAEAGKGKDPGSIPPGAVAAALTGTPPHAQWQWQWQSQSPSSTRPFRLELPAPGDGTVRFDTDSDTDADSGSGGSTTLVLLARDGSRELLRLRLDGGVCAEVPAGPVAAGATIATAPLPFALPADDEEDDDKGGDERPAPW